MAKSIFALPIFHDEAAARAWFEAARWPNGPICPKCGSAKAYPTKKAAVYRCADSTCRKDFTVMTGTVMERSHAKLTQCAVAFHMAASSKKGFSAHQLHRELGCQYNTAWFLHHRVMEAMRRGGLDLPPMGSDGGIVEADETYFGRPEIGVTTHKATGRPLKRPSTSHRNRRPIVALVERGGNVRAFHVPFADKANVAKIVRDNIAREARLHTDESNLYPAVGTEFSAHKTVKHSADEYVRYEDGEAIHTNSAEGFFGIFKRGMRGVYQHCKEKHLHRYVAEFDFRYNTRKLTDMERTVAAVRSGEGKRLTYHQPH